MDTKPVYKTFKYAGKTVNKWVVKRGIKQFDEKENVIYSYNENSGESWYEYEYDSSGNLIHKKNSNGDEVWSEYDSSGNLIHKKDSKGHEE